MYPINKFKLTGKISIIFILIVIYMSINLIFFPTEINAMKLTQKRTVVKTKEEISSFIDDSKYPGYKQLLLNLKENNPKWTFTLLETGLSWDVVMYYEAHYNHARNLVQGKAGEWLCSQCINPDGTPIVHDGTNWYGASEKAVAYIMDPRNYMGSEHYMFQFEALSYIPEIHTKQGVESILEGTFMANKRICDQYKGKYTTKTFAEVIIEAATNSKVSPYHIASRIRQEIGATPSPSVTGTEPGYEGYFNFFNIGASGGNGAIARGLAYARGDELSNDLKQYCEIPWNTPEKAIIGGAKWIAREYISLGQDTLYFQKFEVVGNDTADMFWHQYMQNLTGAKSESYEIYTSYKDLGLLDKGYNFIIPLYLNMPKATYEPKENNYFTEFAKVITNDGASVNLRNEPNGSIIGSVKTGERVVKVDPKNVKAGSYTWSKVIKSNGTVGYVANQHLQTLQIDTSNKEEVVVTTKNDPAVRLRNGPTTKADNIQWVDTGTIIYRIEKGIYGNTGYYWDVVMLKDGTIGFMASEYLKVVETQPPVPSDPTENFDAVMKFNIDDTNRQIAITPGIKLKNIKEENLDKTITAVDKDGQALSDTDDLGTKSKITINDKEYIVIKLGDLNGDGFVDVIDLLLMKRHLIKMITLQDEFNIAAKLSDNNDPIDTVDILLLQRHLIKMTSISLRGI